MSIAKKPIISNIQIQEHAYLAIFCTKLFPKIKL